MAKIKYTNDTVSDMLTRLRNSISAGKDKAVLPNIKIVLELLKVLSNVGFIGGYNMNENEELEVDLKVDGRYKITTLTRLSKPGVRKYVSAVELKPVKYGRGVAIVSTSKGVMSDAQAREHKVGGELLCEIW